MVTYRSISAASAPDPGSCSVRHVQPPDLDSDFSMVEEFANRHGPREKPFWRVTGYIDTQQNSVPIWVTTHTETLPEHTLLPPTNQIKD